MRSRGLLGLLRVALFVTAVASLLAACAGGPILANPPVVRAQPPAAPSPSPAAPDPRPLAFPRDDGPHDRLTEWWYYTGHLRDASGRRFGFEYVIFRAERGALPVSWASHLAITDEAGKRFLYAQRSEIGPQVDRSPRGADGVPTAFDLGIVGLDPSQPAPAGRSAWAMAGALGHDELSAEASGSEAAAGRAAGGGTAGGGGAIGGGSAGGGAAAGGGSPGGGSPGTFGLALRLIAEKPPALHEKIGWIDFGPAGGSYYYSRTRMAATGSLTIDGRATTVEGTAWFDHQWGDFIAVGGGGWDWFAIELADGTDLTLSLVRLIDGAFPLVYGTLVRPDGSTVHLDRTAFSVAVTDHWTSPRTGATYPSAWRIRISTEELAIELRPTVADQELDTRPTSGVIYWEGSQLVAAARAGRRIDGEAYVELTGYAAR